jgi:glycosyltransferase involved in cell wall biosynthesis
MTHKGQPATRVRVFYQIDPAGAVAGGIDSVIRGIAKWAPEDIEISIVGLTMDEAARPIGKWTDVQLGGRTVKFFAVGRNNLPMQRSRIPLSVRLNAGIVRYYREVSQDCDVLEFHRIEPALPFFFDRRYKNMFMHQKMDILYNPNSDMGWKRWPRAYFALESMVIDQFKTVFCVREEAMEAYRQRYPKYAERFKFIPTWMDPQTFHPATPDERQSLRTRLLSQYGLEADADILVSVGRLDQQKNPFLAIAAFAQAIAKRPTARLLMIGDGILRKDVEQSIAQSNLVGRVILTGLKNPLEISQILQASDLYLMSSAYEGMPISVLEAMGTGLPVVSTTVGELKRVVESGRNGQLIDSHEPADLADAIVNVLARPAGPQRAASIELVAPYVPASVLEPVFTAYRTGAAQAKGT